MKVNISFFFIIDLYFEFVLKARYAKLEGLGGVTLSSIGMDDVDGQCGQGPYPLLHAVADVFDLDTNDQSRMKKKISFQKFLFFY